MLCLMLCLVRLPFEHFDCLLLIDNFLCATLSLLLITLNFDIFGQSKFQIRSNRRKVVGRPQGLVYSTL